MNIYLDWLLTILWYICWPFGILVFYLVTFVLTVLKLLYWPIAFVLQPVVFLGRFIAACIALPFKALVRLEVRKVMSPVLRLYLPPSTSWGRAVPDKAVFHRGPHATERRLFRYRYLRGSRATITCSLPTIGQNALESTISLHQWRYAIVA